MSSIRALIGCVAASLALVGPASAQQMDLRQASGVPLPAADLPAGTVSVRVVRDTFANNLSGVDVVFAVNGRLTTIATDASGRAQIEGLAPGSRVSASATVDGRRLESQEVTIAASGIRFVLVGGDGRSAGGSGAPPAPVAGATGAAAAPAARGTVAFGPDSRIVAEYSDERLSVYYVLQIVNDTAGAIDPGGPLVIELPRSARGATVIEGNAAQATAIGSRIVVNAPFPPGTTSLNVAYELPFSGDTAELEQSWPVDIRRLAFFAVKSGTLDVDSPQFMNKQVTDEQGQPLIVGFVDAMKAGEPLSVSLTGLPHRSVWPRNTALALGGALTLAGIWAAVFPAPRRRRA